MRNKYTQAGVALLAVMLISIGCADTNVVDDAHASTYS